MAQFQFNAADHTPSGSGSLVFPVAQYPLQIVKTAFVQVKDKQNAGYLELTLKTLADVGEIPAGSNHKYRFNLFNDNEQTVRIANNDLSRLAWLVGRPTFNDTDQLIGAQFVALIGPQDKNDKYSEVKATFDIQGREYDAAIHGGKGVQAAQSAPVASAPVQGAPVQQPAQTFQQPATTAAPPANNTPPFAPTYQAPAAPPSAPPGFNGQVPAHSPWSRPANA